MFSDPSGYVSIAVHNRLQSMATIAAVGLYNGSRWLAVQLARVTFAYIRSLVGRTALDWLLDVLDPLELDSNNLASKLLQYDDVSSRVIETVTQEEAETRERDQDEDVDIVYRNPSLNPPQHPTAMVTGFHAKNPAATYTITGHILNRSKPGFASQYISVTRSLTIAIQYNQGQPIYAINLNEVVGEVYDLTIPTVFEEHVHGVTAQNWARKSKEVLVVRYVSRTLKQLRKKD